MHQMPSGSFASAQDKIEEMDEEGREEGGGGDGFQCHPCLSQVFVNYVASIEPVPMKNLQPLFEFCNFCSDQFAFYLILQYGTRDGGFGEG